VDDRVGRRSRTRLEWRDAASAAVVVAAAVAAGLDVIQPLVAAGAVVLATVAILVLDADAGASGPVSLGDERRSGERD